MTMIYIPRHAKRDQQLDDVEGFRTTRPSILDNNRDSRQAELAIEFEPRALGANSPTHTAIAAYGSRPHRHWNHATGEYAQAGLAGAWHRTAGTTPRNTEPIQISIDILAYGLVSLPGLGLVH